MIVESAANQGKIRGLSDDVPLLWVVDVVHDKDRTNYYVPNALGVLQLCKLANLEPEEHTPMADIARFTVVCRRKDE